MTAGVVGLILSTAVKQGVDVLRGAPAAAIFLGALALLYAWKSPYAIAVTVLGSALTGWIALGG